MALAVSQASLDLIDNNSQTPTELAKGRPICKEILVHLEAEHYRRHPPEMKQGLITSTEGRWVPLRAAVGCPASPLWTPRLCGWRWRRGCSVGLIC